MNNENFITIQGYMVNELGLKGNELIAYAVINGFSQDGNSAFCGSYSYISSWLNISERQVIRILDGLVEKGLITKQTALGGVNCYGVTKCHSEGMTKCHMGYDKMSHNNNSNNNSNTIVAEHIPPTREEVEGYANEIGYNLDIDYFMDYYSQRGWKIGNCKMKSYKATIRNWKRRNYKTNGTTTESKPSFDTSAIAKMMMGDDIL